MFNFPKFINFKMITLQIKNPYIHCNYNLQKTALNSFLEKVSANSHSLKELLECVLVFKWIYSYNCCFYMRQETNTKLLKIPISRLFSSTNVQNAEENSSHAFIKKGLHYFKHIKIHTGKFMILKTLTIKLRIRITTRGAKTASFNSTKA